MIFLQINPLKPSCSSMLHRVQLYKQKYVLQQCLSVYIISIWFLQQTAIVSLYKINRLVFLMEA